MREDRFDPIYRSPFRPLLVFGNGALSCRFPALPFDVYVKPGNPIRSNLSGAPGSHS